MTGARFYRTKFKPSTIQYLEQHNPQFVEFMNSISNEYIEYVKNITQNYVTYVTKETPRIDEAVGVFIFNEASPAEQTMVTMIITVRENIGSIWLDMVNVTQDTIIRLHHQIDGTNYREISAYPWAAVNSDGVLIDGFTAYRNIRITLACGGGGAGNVNVLYAIV